VSQRLVSASTTMCSDVLIQLFANLHQRSSGGPYSPSEKLEFRVSHRPCCLCEFQGPTPEQVECLILRNQQAFLFLARIGDWSNVESVLHYRNDFVGVYSVRFAAFWTGSYLFSGCTGICFGYNYDVHPAFAAP